MEHGGLSRVAIGEWLVPRHEIVLLLTTDVEVTQNNAH